MVKLPSDILYLEWLHPWVIGQHGNIIPVDDRYVRLLSLTLKHHQWFLEVG